MMIPDFLKITFMEIGTTFMIRLQELNQDKCKSILKLLRKEKIQILNLLLMMIKFTWTNITKSAKIKKKRPLRETTWHKMNTRISKLRQHWTKPSLIKKDLQRKKKELQQLQQSVRRKRLRRRLEMLLKETMPLMLKRVELRRKRVLILLNQQLLSI